ncbi:MAG: BTAD domain-containing putative transcriptional regulator [Candidatus Limnocylindria bacterium]
MAAGRLELRILGPVEALVAGRNVALGGRRQRAVLARLAVAANRVVGTEQLVDDLWGDEPPRAARNTVQTYIARLRRLLPAAPSGSRIATVGSGYVLHLDPDELDASRAERRIVQARAQLAAHRPSEAIAALHSAVDSWRGPTLANMEDLPWVVAERARLEELRAGAIETSAEAELAAGAPQRAAVQLTGLTAEQPLRERAWELLMEALYRAGRQADALDAYHRIRRRLAEELGVDPGPGLRRQEERILRHDPTLMPIAPPHPSPPRQPPRRGNLPIQHTSFIGRVRELEELALHVRRSMLVTVVGVGGSGKTRLAVELAGRMEPELEDGAWFVSLERTADGSAVSLIAAESLGVHEEGGRELERTIADAIAERELLMVLDSCEHLLEAASAFASTLLSRCPHLRVIATSRERLAIPGEQVFSLPPMTVPEQADQDLRELLRTDAASLFVERATRASAGFVVGPQHAADLVRLLQRLDGLPLAVELAATRVRSLGLPQIVHQLDAGGGELRAISRSSAERHRSLRATVEWSFRLLTRPEQRVLARLATFAGLFGAEEAVAVCRDDTLPDHEVVDLLASLVDKSLVVRADGPHADDPSYRLLDTIRSFGAERLGQEPDALAVRTRHASHYIRLAELAEVELRGAHQVAWLHRLDAASSNMAAALDWLIGQRLTEEAYRLTASLRVFWEMRGHMTEGLSWVQRALALESGSASPARGAALLAGADLATGIGDHQVAEDLGREACEVAAIVRDAGLAAECHYVQGLLGKYQGQFRRATVQFERALELHRMAGRTWHLAQTLHHLGMVKGFQGQYPEARGIHEQSLELFRPLGDADSAGSALRSLSIIAIDEGRYDRAESLATEALAICEHAESVMNVAHVRYTIGDVRRLRGDLTAADALYEQSIAELKAGGDRRCVASTLRNRGLVALARGQRDAAQAYLDESLTLRLDLDDRAGVAESYEGLAEIAVSSDDPVRAAELYGAAEALRTAIGAARTPRESSAIDTVQDGLRELLGRVAFDAARARGAARV